ncbi:SDR family NAD(P)-dependent oxidoreductase, partial [Parasphingorhabdus sp.]
MTDWVKYRDRSVMITGAGDGIGKMLAEKLAAMGMRVCVQDIRIDAAENVAHAIGDDAFAMAFDISDRDAVVAAASKFEKQ